MAETTRNLGLPLLAAAQAQKHVTHNEALDALDALVHLGVRDRGRTAPPPNPAEGDRHIVGPAPGGAWTGLAGRVVLRRDGAWVSFVPRPGWIARVEDEAQFVGWDGTAWLPLGETASSVLAKLLTVDGRGSGLDADLLGGQHGDTLAALQAARTLLVGGGLLAVSGAGEVRWGTRLVATGLGRGGHWSGAGSFEIALPPVGTVVAGAGGAADRAVTAAGIPLAPGEALHYALPVGAGAASVPDRFRVVGASAPFALPATWLGLCARDPDSGVAVFWNGLRLAPGQSYDGAATAARPRLSGLGIGAESDAVNALAVASPAILFNHAGEGVQAKLNKAAPERTASLLFQTGFSGRAEFGLVGSDQVSLKVSADGATFVQAFTVDPLTGRVVFGAGAVREEVSVLTASGTWTKPAWAKIVAVACVGGGGGGGSGRRGAAATVRGGGAGGGAGAMNREEFLADDLPHSLTVTVGAGGTGGSAQTVDGTNGSLGGIGGTTSVSADGVVILLAIGGGAGSGGSNGSAVAGTGGQNQSLVPVGAGGSGSSGVGSAGGGGLQGPGGGAGGGGISNGEVPSPGGVGGQGNLVGRNSGSVPGGAVGLGGYGGGDKAWTRGVGGGGGGGGAGPANGSGSGGSGGVGGIPGGGGAGGGGASNGAPSGAGGQGGRGEVWITCRG